MLKPVILDELKSWDKLKNHFTEIQSVHMRELFEKDSDRFSKFSIKLTDLLFDYSKNRITEETKSLLVEFAKEADLKDGIEKMFTGEKINGAEGRAVLHTALRNQKNIPVYFEGEDVMPGINEQLIKVKSFSEAVISGKFKGFTGKKIENVVNIGIGGSDLGPAMVSGALKPYQVGPNVHYVSNVDGTHLAETLKLCKPESTLFIIVSKTFTTQETMTNAVTAKNWLLDALGADIAIRNHFVAVSTNSESVLEFGIAPENQFLFWDWVGGRFSLWSTVGLSVAIHLGYENFEQILNGANEADLHFRNECFEENIPVVMGLLGIWYTNFFGADSHAVLPYDQYLSRFPAYLQQGDMESSGKTVDRQGKELNYETGPIIWGEPGTNGQHAFYQLIHQGSKLIPCDFIGVLETQNPLSDHHQKLFSNFLAQTRALMMGKTESEVEKDMMDSTKGINKNLVPFKIFKGNIPTNSFVLDKLTPFSLGKLIAMYEHKIFVQGYLWNIFSFDQWGVELGKVLAKGILSDIQSERISSEYDSSTLNLLKAFKNKDF